MVDNVDLCIKCTCRTAHKPFCVIFVSAVTTAAVPCQGWIWHRATYRLSAALRSLGQHGALEGLCLLLQQKDSYPGLLTQTIGMVLWTGPFERKASGSHWCATHCCLSLCGRWSSARCQAATCSAPARRNKPDHQWCEAWISLQLFSEQLSASQAHEDMLSYAHVPAVGTPRVKSPLSHLKNLLAALAVRIFCALF